MNHPAHSRDGQHWYMAGRTGTGKTKLKKEIIRKKVMIDPFLNVYHIDTKQYPGDYTDRDGTVIVSETAPDAYTTTGNRMVWKPIRDSKVEYGRFFERILKAGLPCIVDIDECVNMKFGDEIPRELAILALQGRAFGISIMAGTQQVAKSPRELRSQATFIISFLLKNEYDERTMINALELNIKHLGLKKYQFWALDTDSDAPAKKYTSYHQFLPLVH